MNSISAGLDKFIDKWFVEPPPGLSSPQRKARKGDENSAPSNHQSSSSASGNSTATCDWVRNVVTCANRSVAELCDQRFQQVETAVRANDTAIAGMREDLALTKTQVLAEMDARGKELGGTNAHVARLEKDMKDMTQKMSEMAAKFEQQSVRMSDTYEIDEDPIMIAAAALIDTKTSTERKRLEEEQLAREAAFKEELSRRCEEKFAARQAQCSPSAISVPNPNRLEDEKIEEVPHARRCTGTVGNIGDPASAAELISRLKVVMRELGYNHEQKCVGYTIIADSLAMLTINFDKPESIKELRELLFANKKILRGASKPLWCNVQSSRRERQPARILARAEAQLPLLEEDRENPDGNANVSFTLRRRESQITIADSRVVVFYLRQGVPKCTKWMQTRYGEEACDCFLQHVVS